MARSFAVLLLAGTALAGCASAPPPQVVYVERPYPAPLPRYMEAPYGGAGADCAPHAMRPPHAMGPPHARAEPQFRAQRPPAASGRPAYPARPPVEPPFRAQRPPHGGPYAHVPHQRVPAARRPEIAKR